MAKPSTRGLIVEELKNVLYGDNVSNVYKQHSQKEKGMPTLTKEQKDKVIKKAFQTKPGKMVMLESFRESSSDEVSEEMSRCVDGDILDQSSADWLEISIALMRKLEEFGITQLKDVFSSSTGKSTIEPIDDVRNQDWN